MTKGNGRILGSERGGLMRIDKVLCPIALGEVLDRRSDLVLTIGGRELVPRVVILTPDKRAGSYHRVLKGVTPQMTELARGAGLTQ